MAIKEQTTLAAKEKTKQVFWKLVGYAALAVGALVVINYFAAKL